MSPKFDDCRSCRFFNRRVENPTCRECDHGEFFEERFRSETPTKDELMTMFGRMNDDG